VFNAKNPGVHAKYRGGGSDGVEFESWEQWLRRPPLPLSGSMFSLSKRIVAQNHWDSTGRSALEGTFVLGILQGGG
jgi:hypothetical protein